MTCVTQKTALFQYVIRVYPIDIQRERAGLLPPSLTMYGLQAKQLLFLGVKFFLRDYAAVQQFFEFFQFIGGGNWGACRGRSFFLFFCPFFISVCMQICRTALRAFVWISHSINLRYHVSLMHCTCSSRPGGCLCNSRKSRHQYGISSSQKVEF